MVNKTACLICCLIIAFSFINQANAQQSGPAIQWQKCLGGTGEDKANDILINPDGSYVVVGYSKSNNGDVSGHHGSLDSSDAWIVKLNSAGGIIWQRSIGGTGKDTFRTVIATNDNAYLCIGSTTSNDGEVSGNHGRTDVFVVKVSTAGAIMWSKCYGGTGRDEGVDAILTTDGNYGFIGTALSNDGDVVSGNGGWVVKINPSGNIIWTKGMARRGYSINISEDGNLYALVSGDSTYIGGIWPNEVPIHKTPGKLFKLDLITGIESLTATLGGDSSFAMYKAPTGYYFSFLDEVYFYPEYCFDEALYVQFKPNGSNTFQTLAYETTNQCTDYDVLLMRIGHHGIAVEENKFIGVGDHRTSQTSPGEDDSQAMMNNPNYNVSQSFWSPLIYPGGKNFNSIKIFPAGKDYLLAGSATEGDASTGYHNAPGNPHDFWVVRLQGLNTVIGNVYVDQNNNNMQDPGELPFNNAIVKTKKTGVEVGGLAYNGSYKNTTDTGTFITTISINRPYYTATPISETSVFTTYKNIDTINFAVHPIPGIQDYTVSAVSLLPARPGFELQYRIVFTNNGTDTLINKSVLFIRDPRAGFVSAIPAPSGTSGDTIRWNIASLLPTEGDTIILNMILGTIPQVNPGDQLTSFVYLDSTGDVHASDNYRWLYETVTGSYDPNDKKEDNNGEIYPQFIAEGRYLNYTIRFQNTGNDTAFNIMLRDTFDVKLNGDSIEVIAASHPYTVNIKDKKYLTVAFNNIKLVDSIHNEPLSHGYFSYRIKPVSTLVLGDSIRNNASIYFDFNPPIKTNTQLTILKPRPITILWTGAVSTAWENPLNWGNNLIPDANTDVIINAGLPRYPVINSNAICRSILIKPGTSVLVTTGNTLKVAH